MVAELIEFPLDRSKARLTSDPDLAAKAVAGDARAFEELVRRHQGTVRGMLLRLSGNPANADDLAQATFLKAWTQLPSYAGGQFRSWLCAIAYREFLQDVRRQKSRRNLHEKVEADGMPVIMTETMGVTHDLERALGKLPEKQRIAVTLCVGAGLSHSEAAMATGWPLGTVKSHVSRGKNALKKLLMAYGAA